MRVDQGAGKAGQIENEQQSVDAMYARLDAAISSSLSAQARTIAWPIEGPEDLYARDVELSRLADNIRKLRSAERSLCFGRIDDEQSRSLHIGRVGLSSDEGDVMLVDWRAEAARPFYSATMASPLGLRRRRHLRVDDRKVVEVTDEILDGTTPTAVDIVGDGPLVSALSGARTGRMREAAATLQREQDEIVRSPHRGIMVVDGGPGTGKTIVALHRAAHMLYAFPSIAERGVLVFGPNRRFLAYISDVLPSLGENDVQLATVADLIGVEATRTEPEELARIKGRAQFADGLAHWVRAHEPHGVSLRLHTAHGGAVFDSARVDAALRSALQGEVGHNRARERFTEYVVDELVNELEQRTANEISDFEDEIKEVLGIDLDRMFSSGPGSTSSDDAEATASGLDIDWDRIHDELLDDPGIDRVIDDVWPRLRAEDVVRGLLADRAALAQALPGLSAKDLALIADPDRVGWSSADLALLDEARALVDGLPETTYGHLVVDEAQQLSEMQWRMLMRRCPNRSMTVVGDLAQAGPTTTVRSWGDALEQFVADRFVHHTLTVNYRTTAEILEATEPVLARIAPEQRLSRSIRHGEHPTVSTVADDRITPALDDLIAQLREEHPEELIGVVAAAQRAVSLNVGTRAAVATIVAAPDARGLEFDTVIVVAPDEIQSAGEAGIRDFYVAQTRATKRLVMLTISTVPGSRPRGRT